MLDKIRESCQWTVEHLEGISPDENTMTKEEIDNYYLDFRDINNQALKEVDTIKRDYVLIKIEDLSLPRNLSRDGYGEIDCFDSYNQQRILKAARVLHKAIKEKNNETQQ